MTNALRRIPVWVRLMRPLQWSKNAVVLAGLVFSGNAGVADLVLRAVLATIAFCLVSSSMYVFNDWHDRAEDRLHPLKQQRPIASGAIQPERALGLGIALLGLGLILAAAVSLAVALVVLTYALLMVAYTLRFREMAVVDILVIATGFVLRAIAGAVAVSVSISVWLFVCTLLLALMLGVGKRRQEVKALGMGDGFRRPSLAGYSRSNLDAWLAGLGVMTILAYTLYTFAVPSYGRGLPMIVTVPFVIAAIGRYLYLVFRFNLGGSPELLLVRDRILLGCIVSWMVAAGAVLAS
jgi:4-hydroxybenzoate polyprenyltransferase